MAASAKLVNPNAEVVSKGQTLAVNVMAARGLQNVLATNLGPRGTLKMLVGGAGQIKITKDGNVLLHEMQIQHPTATLIARAATAQDDVTGDGTTSTVLFCAELLRQAERYLAEGLHPRHLTDGFDQARDLALQYLEQCRVEQDALLRDREQLMNVARTSLRTKLTPDVADDLATAVVDALGVIAKDGEAIDLHMVETMHMKHRSAADSTFVQGIVLDHGVRHPDMPRVAERCRILTCNVSFEYEKSEHASGFFYSNAEQREKLVESERKFTDDKVKQVIEFKRRVCEEGETMVIINQKGIDPMSLDMFAREGIIALRRAKRRNMERLTLACGGMPVNSVDDLTEDCLGFAGKVHEETLGDDTFTFVENVRNPRSCTVLLRGPNDHTIAQLKDALRDGLRAVKNAVDDGCLIPGAGAFEVGAARFLRTRLGAVGGQARMGVEAYAEALKIIPKTLAANSGLDQHQSMARLEDEQESSGELVGLDLTSGEPMLPAQEGVWDNYIVKKQILQLSTVLATQLLLVDEVMRAGKQMGGAPAMNPDEMG